MNLDKAFMDIMTASQEDYTKAQVIDNWKPEIGDYTCVVGEIATGVKENDDGSRMAWAKLPGTIIAQGDPILDQRTFGIGFYTSKNLSGLKTDVACLTGRTIGSITDAIAILQSVVGWVVNVNVRAYKNKNKEIVKVVSITDVIDRNEAQPTTVSGPTLAK